MDKRLSDDNYLKAVALFTMANRHYVEATKFQKALSKHLGYDDNWAGRLGDFVLEDGAQAETALAEEGFRRLAKPRNRKKSG